MKHNYFLKTFFLLLLFTALSSCGSDDSETYVKVSPVNLDLEAVPYETLSEYKFFDGPMKNLEPAYKVIPYDLNSALFTDYAHKKRFVWMPEGVSATYGTDGTVLSFPTGTVFIKNFYYENVQPANTTLIIETRLMIKKEDGWIFANYVWNEAQTEAVKNTQGGFVDIAWMEGTTPKSTTYNIPSQEDCHTCHKTNEVAIPIGPKPQNLNKDFNYADGAKNQLSKWIQEGYLTNTVPGTIASTVDWTDESKSMDLRVRSYLDINCAHCHTDNGHCDYMAMRFAFNQTTNPTNIGICVEPFESTQPFLVAKRDVERSAVHARMTTNQASKRMPLIGRTIIHDEGVALMEQWINSMDGQCE